LIWRQISELAGLPYRKPERACLVDLIESVGARVEIRSRLRVRYSGDVMAR
jgi:hypothetical protein